ncbi:MAG: Ppx/GppA phosphatase family protein [Verrucomicrobiota bacterium]
MTPASPRRRFAIVDIGSNSVKFLAGEPLKTKLKIIDDASIPTRLAEGLLRTGELKAEAMKRTFDVLRELRERADGLGVEALRPIATSAVRDSSNRKRFLREAGSILGETVRILSGVQEAEAIFAGVSLDPHFKRHGIISVEVGGGSAQWTAGDNTGVEHRLSLPLGAVRLRERFIPDHPVTPAVLGSMRKALGEQLGLALAPYSLDGKRLVGTGGTVTTLVAVMRKLKVWDPRKVDHTVLRKEDLSRFLNRLSKLPLGQIRKLPGLPPKREDLMIPGGCVFLATMDVLGAEEMTISVRGLRYALLHQLVQERC